MTSAKALTSLDMTSKYRGWNFMYGDLWHICQLEKSQKAIKIFLNVLHILLIFTSKHKATKRQAEILG